MANRSSANYTENILVQEMANRPSENNIERIGAPQDSRESTGLQSFNKSYDDLVHPERGRSLLGAEGLWSRLFQYFPFIGSFFVWHKMYVRRNSQPPSLEMKKPGIFTLRILIDGAYLLWLGYLDAAPPEDVDFDPRPSYENEYTNCGILSALLLTVWYSFMTQGLSDDHSSLEIAYNIVWANAFMLACVSTLLSVLFLLVINEMANSKEAIHFLDVLDDATRGFGPHAPVIFLYFSLLSALCGLYLWFIITYGPTSLETIFIFIVSLIIGAAMIIFYLHAVAALYIARHTQAKIQLNPPFHITSSQIRKDLNEYAEELGGFEMIESAAKLVKYVESKQRGDSAIYKRNLTETAIKIIVETYEEEVKQYVASSIVVHEAKL